MIFGLIYILIIYTLTFVLISVIILDYGFWPNFLPNTMTIDFGLIVIVNTIDYGFCRNCHRNTVD